MKISSIAVALSILVTACSHSGLLRDYTGEELPVLGDDAFVGEIVELRDFDAAGWTTSDGYTRGGPASDFRTGSAQFVLYNGDVISVEAGTPGGNDCLLLNPYEQSLEPVDAGLGDEPCAVTGVYGHGSSAQWFATGETELSRAGGTYGFPLAGFRLPNEAVVWIARDVLVAVPITPAAEWRDCTETGAAPVGTDASSRDAAGVAVDANTLEVVLVGCAGEPVEKMPSSGL